MQKKCSSNDLYKKPLLFISVAFSFLLIECTSSKITRIPQTPTEFIEKVDRRYKSEEWCREFYCATKIQIIRDTLVLGKKELGRRAIKLFYTPKSEFSESQINYIDSVMQTDTMFIAVE